MSVDPSEAKSLNTGVRSAFLLWNNERESVLTEGKRRLKSGSETMHERARNKKEADDKRIYTYHTRSGRARAGIEESQLFVTAGGSQQLRAIPDVNILVFIFVPKR